MQNQILLEQQMLNLKQDNHLCLIYDKDPLEQMPALVPFIKQGLENNEQFIYIADDLSVEQLSLILKINRIDVDAEIDRGALKLWTRKEWRQPGELDSIEKSKQVHEVIDGAIKAGFEGIRFAVEMTWTLDPDITAEKLETWESTINTIFPRGFPGKMICQYNRHRLPASVINQAFRTHPLAILENYVCHNAFYEEPNILNDKSETFRSEWIIHQLKEAYLRFIKMQNENEVNYLSDLVSKNKSSLSSTTNIIKVLGKKYAIFLLSLIGNNGSIRFGEIKNKLGGISSSTLSHRLDELKAAGLIERDIYPEIPPKVEYSLSKNGAKLLKTLNPLL